MENLSKVLVTYPVDKVIRSLNNWGQVISDLFSTNGERKQDRRSRKKS